MPAERPPRSRSAGRSAEVSSEGASARGESARATGDTHLGRTPRGTLEIDKPEVEAFRVAFGGNLRSLRLAAGLSQEQLKARCFLHHARVTALEGGDAPPSLELLILLCDALDVSLEDLTHGLVAPTRTASRTQILALLAEQPGSTTRELAASSRLPEAYVFDLIHYLAAWGTIHRQGMRWQLAPTRDERPGAG